MSNTTHTPTPWENHNGTIEGEEGGFHIADIKAYFRENEAVQAANAAFIVRAVNSHEQLLKCLRDGRVAIDVLMARLIEVDPSFMPTQSPAWPALVAIKSALAAAEA